MYSNEDIAIAKIKSYLNVLDNPKWTKDYVLNNYGIAVEMLRSQANNSVAVKGAKSISENGTSITFLDNVGTWNISNDIAEFLPSPFVKFMG